MESGTLLLCQASLISTSAFSRLRCNPNGWHSFTLRFGGYPHFVFTPDALQAPPWCDRRNGRIFVPIRIGAYRSITVVPSVQLNVTRASGGFPECLRSKHHIEPSRWQILCYLAESHSSAALSRRLSSDTSNRYIV